MQNYPACMLSLRYAHINIHCGSTLFILNFNIIIKNRKKYDTEFHSKRIDCMEKSEIISIVNKFLAFYSLKSFELTLHVAYTGSSML